MIVRDGFDFLIQWHLTERCNLACSHCYQSGGRSGELDLAEVGEVMDEIVSMFDDWEQAHGVRILPSFNITGGEPLLRSDLFEILEMLAMLRFPCFLLTNGTLVDRGAAQRLADTGLKGAQVSIEGPHDVHDAIRGSSSFVAACDGIRHLVAAGIPVTVNVTVSRLNAPYLAAMVALARDLGAARLGFSRLVPFGRGEEIIGQTLTPGELKELYEGLLFADHPGIEIVTGDPVANQMKRGSVLAGRATPFGGCAAGVSGLTILADGTVTPCRRLEIPLGNIRTDSLREIWATSEVLRHLRNRGSYSGKCASCSRWSECRGCRGIAYALSLAQGAGAYTAEDPQCFLA